MKNRKDRRAAAAKARKNGTGEEKEPFEAQLQREIHALINRLVPPGAAVDQRLLKEIVRGLGHAASIYAHKGDISRDGFAEGMGGYYDALVAVLDASEPKGPTLELS